MVTIFLNNKENIEKLHKDTVQNYDDYKIIENKVIEYYSKGKCKERFILAFNFKDVRQANKFIFK